MSQLRITTLSVALCVAQGSTGDRGETMSVRKGKVERWKSAVAPTYSRRQTQPVGRTVIGDPPSTGTSNSFRLFRSRHLLLLASLAGSAASNEKAFVILPFLRFCACTYHTYPSFQNICALACNGTRLCPCDVQPVCIRIASQGTSILNRRVPKQ